MQLAFSFELPPWVASALPGPAQVFTSVEQRMRLVLDLAGQNIEHRTGGPFAAAVFGPDGVLVAPGINLVTTRNCSILHAEMVAIALAQQTLGCYDLGAAGSGGYELVTSTEPCAMCFGAVPWSGVKRLVCGARSSDACRIGFDEGAKPACWPQALEKRGITVVRDVLRRQAAAVLQRYAQLGQPIYNPE